MPKTLLFLGCVVVLAAGGGHGLTAMVLLAVLVMLLFVYACSQVLGIALAAKRPRHLSPRAGTTTMAGDLPLLNGDWAGEAVWRIGDARVPPPVAQHGARFSPPAQYVLAVSESEFLLYAADGQWLDACFLK